MHGHCRFGLVPSSSVIDEPESCFLHLSVRISSSCCLRALTDVMHRIKHHPSSLLNTSHEAGAQSPRSFIQLQPTSQRSRLSRHRSQRARLAHQFRREGSNQSQQRFSSHIRTSPGSRGPTQRAGNLQLARGARCSRSTLGGVVI
jgi:hypothetical protein